MIRDDCAEALSRALGALFGLQHLDLSVCLASNWAYTKSEILLLDCTSPYVCLTLSKPAPKALCTKLPPHWLQHYLNPSNLSEFFCLLPLCLLFIRVVV
mmetsp:Transcript_71975/g.192239  ORF Transcript_71975/g.192239 Transcript_71975/m.192239 type:complete len:99 (-) Transcript_71975:125-421(-)